MEVYIVSKTRMIGHCCVGGLTQQGQHVRLFTATDENQPENTAYQIGQTWQMDIRNRPNIDPPHVEDVIVDRAELLGYWNARSSASDLLATLGVNVWRGNADELFDRMIRWSDYGSGFIGRNAIPAHSVGFWIADSDIEMIVDFGRTKYQYSTNPRKLMSYKGYQEPIRIIPAGTLIRVSLARWYNLTNQCALQLSGWYL